MINVRRPDKLWILCVGQARLEKRVEWAIRAAKRMRIEFPKMPFCFAYVGNGPALQSWQNMVRDAGIESDFIFMGAQSDVLPFYQCAALMVHAAVRESFGLAIVEAMSCAIPVVATAAAGPSETIMDGLTGTLVEVEDEEGFYQAVVAYVCGPALRQKHGAKARERAVTMYSINRQARQYAEVLRLVA